MASSASNMQSTKDASAKIDGVKLSPNVESSEETHTVKTVDISRSAGQTQDVITPVEIVHETSPDASAKIDGVKLSPGCHEACRQTQDFIRPEESSEETHTVKAVDISRSAGQTQDVIKPVEIVHETPATEDATSKKE